MKNFSDSLKGVNLKELQNKSILWRGPEVDDKNGGITFTALNYWISCPERFRIKYCLGLSPSARFNNRLEYGNIWHECEEIYAGGSITNRDGSLDIETLGEHLGTYSIKLKEQYPFDSHEVDKWVYITASQFPYYVEYWKNHSGSKKITPLLQEQVFKIPYRLPSSRIVYLRGKWDSVYYLDGDLESQGIWLQENKSKGTVDEEKIQRNLKCDMQTMTYLIALERYDWTNKYDVTKSESPVNIWKSCQIKGVRYNVVRRPLSGGKGTIRQKKPSKKNPLGESTEDFYSRLSEYFADDQEKWFYRWDVKVSQQDIDRFKKKVLNPLLEQLCDWYDWVKDGDPWRQGNKLHYVRPFGLFSGVDEYGESPYDHFIMNGDETGLKRDSNLFPELV